MTSGVISSKEQMYDLLLAGAFGNTVPQFLSVGEWERSPEYDQYAVWGVRTLTPGGPCRLYCPRDEVRATAEAYLAGGHRINVSMMVDAICRVTLFAEVRDAERGLEVYGVEYPGPGASWRRVMPTRGRTWAGLAARGLLDRHMNPSSRADLEALRDLYPDHVYEFSACDRVVGTVPGRNCIVWECRCADGRYEHDSWRRPWSPGVS